MLKEVWPEDLKGSDHLEEISVGGRITLKWFLEKYILPIFTRYMLLNIGTNGGLL
jgi:hypothetical protein